MTDQQALGGTSEKKPPVDGEPSMKEIWASAAKAFETICGESLQRGEVKGFDDVQRKIESSGKASFDTDAGQEDNWDKAKSVGLESLKYLKMLVGAASQASSLIPIPSAAANITGTALCFVFDIPQAIRGYNDAINEVFGKVAPALSQFQIYQSMDSVDRLLIKQIHLVLVSFVRICAHVVKYRQGRKRDRFLQHVKSIFENDSGLASEMEQFQQALQGQRDVQGTVTLAVVAETRRDVALVLEQSIVFSKTAAETQQVVQETHKGVQALKEDSDHTKTLVKIRDSLGVWPTVRLDTNTTQTCIDISDKCLDGTGSWIWTHDAYVAWTAAASDKDNKKDTSHVLVLSGPPSSGKTSATALISKRLEEQKGRTYIGHYFFPASAKKSDSSNNNPNPVALALKYMAFQISRVDATVQKALGKACDAGPAAFRRSASPENLEALWRELKIGMPGSSATYYLIFDGLENLPDKQAEILLGFVFGSRLATEDTDRRVRILVSGTDDQLSNWLPPAGRTTPLRIHMEKHNGPDMRIVIEGELGKQGMLQNARANSEQQKAKDKILEKLPRNVNGSYSLLKFGLSGVIRLLNTRTAVQELDRMLDQSMSSHEEAIKNMQRSLTADEIAELNELLSWVLFDDWPRTLGELEGVMWLYSGIESLTSLEYIIKSKYSAVLKVEEGYVYAQDGVQEYLQKKKESLGRSSLSKDHSTISMTITINNVDQELCGHFLWDLADIAIRDKFKFNFNSDASNSMHIASSHGAIAIDEFEANHTIVTRTFEYLNKEPSDRTKEIGVYLLYNLPYYLGRLRQLEDEDKGALMPHEQHVIGQNLYTLFNDNTVFQRHKATFEQLYWTAGNMEEVQKWLMDSAVVRRLDRRWRTEVQQAANPVRGYLKVLVRMVVVGLLRERSWKVSSAWWWLEEFMAADEKKEQKPHKPSDANLDDSNSSSSASAASRSNIDWNHVSTWCQGILGLPDTELDSLWYERLAETSYFLGGNNLDLASLLYQQAIEKGAPSWLCYRGLGTTHYSQGRSVEAIAQIELAVRESEREGATPKPEAKDIVELHLLLGKYSYETENLPSAAEHYAVACKSDDAEQTLQGQLGHLKVTLSSPDVEKARTLLKSTFLASEGREGEEEEEGSIIIRVLKIMVRDLDHEAIISNMFAIAKEEPDLLKGIVRAMQTAATAEPPAPLEHGSTISETTLEQDDRFAEDEARGVLLYYLGVAAHTYKVSTTNNTTEPASEALRLWAESRDRLARIGGRNAFVVRTNATSALANHYFQHMVDDGKLHQDHLEALTKLVQDDSDGYYNESAWYLAMAYAQYGDKEKSREVLAPKVKEGLQILSDDTPENDDFGFFLIRTAMQQCLSFENAAIALSFEGQPDLVVEALQFEVEDITGDHNDEDKQRALDIAIKLAEETVRAVKSQVPDASAQIQRIEAANIHVDSLAASSDPDPVAGIAHRLLQTRLSQLKELHTPKLSATAYDRSITCDGRTPDGKKCKNQTSFEREFYHCTYCTNEDFCPDCFACLRDPGASDVITSMVCSAKHRWLRMPPQGDDAYVGLRAKRVRVPSSVQAADGDEQILVARYAEDGGGEEITLKTWMERVAGEWGISLQGIKDDMSRQATHEGEEDKGEVDGGI